MKKNKYICTRSIVVLSGILLTSISLTGKAQTVFAEITHEALVDQFVLDAIIPVDDQYLADALVLGVTDETTNGVLAELFISYLIVPPEKVTDARTFVGTETPIEPVLTVTLSGTNPVETIFEVDTVTVTEDIVLTTFVLDADVDLEIFELPVRVSAGASDIDDVVSEVYLLIDGEVYYASTQSFDGTSELVTFTFGSAHGKPRLVVSNGNTVTVSIVVSLYGQEGNYLNGELVNAYISNQEISGMVVQQYIPNTTPAILAKLLIAKGIVSAENVVSVETLATTFSETDSADYIEACISAGFVATDFVASARALLYENTGVTLEGSALGETHTLQHSGIYAENASTDAWADSFGDLDDIIGIFEIQFDITAFAETYFLSATNTSIFDISIKDDDGAVVPEATVTAVLSVSSTAEREGDAYRLEQGETYFFTLRITIHPGVAGTYRAQLNSIDFGTSAVDTTGEVAYEVSPPEEFETDPLYLESDQQPDTTNPTIALLGSNPLRVLRGSALVDPGATAYDAVDGDITSAIVVTSDVDIYTVGLYTITYTVQDSAGNENAIQRSVVVYSAGGGGGDTNDRTPPTNTSVSIEDGSVTTKQTEVTLSLNALDPSKPITMKVSNSRIFSDAVWVPYKKKYKHTLSSGEGTKTVYVMFRDARGNVSEVVTDSITYDLGAQPPLPGQVRGSTRYFFENDIALGMENTDVSELQIRLREEGFFTHPTITGYFGSLTASAVQAYQKQHGVDMTGYVGPLTRAKLNSVLVSGSNEEVITLDAFVRLLISLGIIPEDKIEMALASL